MTDQGRVWWTRAILLVGLILAAAYPILRWPTETDITIFGRYMPPLGVMLLCAGVLLGGIAFALLPGLRPLVLSARFRAKMIVFALWLPVSLAIYTMGYNRTPLLLKPIWNVSSGRLFWAATLAMILVTLDALQAAVRRPEFWLAVGSVAFALGLVEAGARILLRDLEDEAVRQLLYSPALTAPTQLRFQPHHYEGYILRPGWSSPDGLDRINSLGYRGDEIEVPKPDGVYRIVTLGGSTTYGTGVDDWRDAYPAQLEDVLHEDYGYTNIEVINGGVIDYNSWESLVNLEFRALDLEPDLVILYQNTNDVDARIVPSETYRGDNSGLRKGWDAQAVTQALGWPMRVPSVALRLLGFKLGWFDTRVFSLSAVVSNTCTGHLAESECMGLTLDEALEANPPIYYERNVRNIVAVAQVNGVEVLLLTWAHKPVPDDYSDIPAYQAAYAEQNDLVRRIAAELDTHFYDFAADMPLDADFWSDGRHMTAEGNRLRAELIAAHIDEAGVIPLP
jgi:lysophospholipase L1-like esterase